ncbi:MAG: hypothetical protein ACRDRQ_05865 [Pseudonocardiaceae bacterium]
MPSVLVGAGPELTHAEQFEEPGGGDVVGAVASQSGRDRGWPV